MIDLKRIVLAFLLLVLLSNLSAQPAGRSAGVDFTRLQRDAERRMIRIEVTRLEILSRRP